MSQKLELRGIGHSLLLLSVPSGGTTRQGIVGVAGSHLVVSGARRSPGMQGDQLFFFYVNFSLGFIK